MGDQGTLQVIALSDHTGDKLREAREARAACDAERLQVWEEAQRDYEATRWVRRVAARRTWRDRRVGAWIIATLRLVGHALFTRPPVRPLPMALGYQEQVWAAGHEGEGKVQAQLMAQLGPAWVVLAGYRNGKGEADLLVVGPPGVLGIEVKHIAGVVHVDGESWTRDRYDRYGNCVGRNEPIRDRGGRSPAGQVNEVLKDLATFLAKRQTPPPILRAVVLTHPQARLGNVKGLGVNFVGTVSQLDIRGLFTSCAAPLTSPLDVQRVVALITRDHTWHARRHEGRQGDATHR
ncbi:nuclease-related domain-containing protein [Rhodanobacter aciditrophus]|uniref:nuclease-related domain-containing protein n=1 Tax=Rhodanobacter aciditrophus TaxID=1623218 RepID=UPI003CF3D811